jgi:hypothetical protein
MTTVCCLQRCQNQSCRTVNHQNSQSSGTEIPLRH